MLGDFSKRVYDLALSIPEGRVTTYGAIANAAGFCIIVVLNACTTRARAESADAGGIE